MKMEESDKEIVFPRDLQFPEGCRFGINGPGLDILPIVGMAGMGKTALAYRLFTRLRSYEFYAWVRVGPNYDPRRIWRNILQQIDPRAVQEGDERSRVTEILSNRNYLIALDDVWDSQIFTDLSELFEDSRFLKRSFLLTTRQQDVALWASQCNVVQMPFLNNDESWALLRRKVFDGKPCPHELEKAGKKIADKCDGLPLTIVTVATILSESQHKTREHWEKIAERTKHPVFMEAYNQIYEVLRRSYEYMPSYLNQCYLYMGVFALKQEIRTSKLTKLWSVENFLETFHPLQTSPLVAVECLKEFHNRSLVLKIQESWNGGVKNCRLHSAFWYLCNRLGREEKVFMALDTLDDCMVEYMERQHRLSFHNSVLFAIKDLRSLIDPVSPVRSLLCFGPYHQYEVPICSHLRFLKVLDALSIRFYDFPVEVVDLNELKYLALTCNTDLPPTVSKLKLLEFLIVLRHQSIKSSGTSSSMYLLPMEVWDMEELKHLQVTGSNLPDPQSHDKLLPNLLTLLQVGARSCTRRVLQRIPNLEKLGILIELGPDGSTSSCFGNHIPYLEKLTSLKCEVVNPTLVPPPPLPNLPLGLKKLSLSGFGYPWEEMRKIALLPNLQVLKLRCYAFHGRTWQYYGNYGIGDEEFKQLKYLHVEDTDLVQWIPPPFSFPNIKRLILKNCYRLQKLPVKFWCSVQVDLVDCNPLAAEYPSQVCIPGSFKKVHATNSWEKQG